MYHKAAVPTHNISNTFDPGTANRSTVQCGSRSFAKKTRTLKTKSVVAGHWKLSVTN